MATRKQSDLIATVTPEPDDAQQGGAPAVDDQADTPADAPAAPAPAPDPKAGTSPSGFFPPSSIPVHVGTSGYYTGARPYEALADYNARLDTVANTFGDLGWLIGTKPRA